MLVSMIDNGMNPAETPLTVALHYSTVRDEVHEYVSEGAERGQHRSDEPPEWAEG